MKTHGTEDSLNNRIVRMAYNKGYRVRDGVAHSPTRPLKGYLMQGYPHFSIKIPGMPGAKKVAIHRLVAFQKFGEEALKPGVHCRHLDGNPLNNAADNIEIGTAQDNSMDRPKSARISHAKLAASYRRKYSPAFIAKLEHENKLGVSFKKLEAKYGIRRSTLSYHLSKSAKRRVSQ